MSSVRSTAPSHLALLVGALVLAVLLGIGAAWWWPTKQAPFDLQAAQLKTDSELRKQVYSYVDEVQAGAGVSRPVAVAMLRPGVQSLYIVLQLQDAIQAVGFEQLVFTQGSELLPPAFRAFSLFPGTQEEDLLRSSLKVKLQMESAMRAANISGDWTAVQKAFPANPLTPYAATWTSIAPNTSRYLRKLMHDHPELF